MLDGLADTDLLKQLLAALPERIEFLVSERDVGHVRGTRWNSGLGDRCYEPKSLSTVRV